MNIVFLFGNGFDLAAGLETKFSQFTDYYVKQHPSKNSNALVEFKNSIRKEQDKWANAEEQMGVRAGKCYNEEELREFCDNMKDYKTKLSEYLQIQQRKTTQESFIKNIAKFCNDIETFIKTYLR